MCECDLCTEAEPYTTQRPKDLTIRDVSLQWDTSFTELTADEHDTDGEDLLRVGVWGDVPEAHTGQTTEGEVQSRDIFVSNGRTWRQDGDIVRFPQLLAQIVQPADPSWGWPLHISYGVPTVRRQDSSVCVICSRLCVSVTHSTGYGNVPDAGQPVGDEGKGAHEEEEDSCTVLRVPIQLPGYTNQSK